MVQPSEYFLRFLNEYDSESPGRQDRQEKQLFLNILIPGVPGGQFHFEIVSK
jgi:hypothetical protein